MERIAIFQTADGGGHSWSIRELTERGRSEAVAAGIPNPTNDRAIPYALTRAAEMNPLAGLSAAEARAVRPAWPTGRRASPASSALRRQGAGWRRRPPGSGEAPAAATRARPRRRRRSPRRGRALAPEPKSPFSTSSTSTPFSARSRNVPMPLIPPPIIRTDTFGFWRRESRVCWRVMLLVSLAISIAYISCLFNVNNSWASFNSGANSISSDTLS